MTLKDSWWTFWVYSFGNNVCARESGNKFVIYYVVYNTRDMTAVERRGEILSENIIRYETCR